MRTTIRIDDDLYRAVKARAARSGRPVGAVIEDAVRQWLHSSRERAESELDPLPTYGGSGTLPGVDLADGAALRDVMEGDESTDALR
jgi:hypothetical protein